MKKSLHILVVDDDQRLCDFLRRYLSSEGYRVSTALNGSQMRHIIKQDLPDLVLLDLILPDDDGLSLAKELRVYPKLGIIILTGKGEIVDKVVGLEIGADDYIAKPFDNRELLARVRSVLRRSNRASEVLNSQDRDKLVARFANWAMDMASHELVSLQGERADLTSNEFKLLSIFIKHSNQILDRSRILELMADREWHPNDRSIDVLISKLRKKIEQDPDDPVLIKTIRGAGYMFTCRIEFE